MNNGKLRIRKTIQVENPLDYTEWCNTYKFGSRAEKRYEKPNNYATGEYDINKLINIVKDGSSRPAWYERIFGFKIA